MKLIVGLGNIGPDYDGTRHNVGFATLDRLVEKYGLQPFTERKGRHALESGLKEVHSDEPAILIKPTTMMNLSGRAVAAEMAFYKIEPHDVWVIYDDLDLPFGTIRIKRNATPGTHNGLRSIYDHIKRDVLCFRIGISNETYERDGRRKHLPLGEMPEAIPAAPFVLQRFGRNETPLLPAIYDTVIGELMERMGENELSEDTTTHVVAD